MSLSELSWFVWVECNKMEVMDWSTTQLVHNANELNQNTQKGTKAVITNSQYVSFILFLQICKEYLFNTCLFMNICFLFIHTNHACYHIFFRPLFQTWPRDRNTSSASLLWTLQDQVLQVNLLILLSARNVIVRPTNKH